jgi:hypothetical protein
MPAWSAGNLMIKRHINIQLLDISININVPACQLDAEFRATQEAIYMTDRTRIDGQQSQIADSVEYLNLTGDFEPSCIQGRQKQQSQQSRDG